MTLEKYLLYAVLGKLIIFIIQIFPFPKRVTRVPFLSRLIYCDFCLGCWIYFLGALVFGLRMEALLPSIPILSEFLLGITTSFLVHLITLGWNARFRELRIE